MMDGTEGLGELTVRELDIWAHRPIKKDDGTQVFLTDETEVIFRSAIEDFRKDPDNTAPIAVMLAFVTGLRRGEVVALKESDSSLNTLQVCRMERVGYTISAIWGTSTIRARMSWIRQKRLLACGSCH